MSRAEAELVKLAGSAGEGVMQTQWSPKESEPASKAAAVARALSILYSNSRVYGIEHAVFRKTVNEHMPSVQDALAETEELTFSFLKGKVRCGSFLLEPSSTVFQSLAHTLEGMGVSGFSIRRGVSAEELSKLVGMLTSRAADLAKQGLQSLLDKEQIKHIEERKPTLDPDGRLKPPEPPEKKKAPKSAVAAPAGRTFVLDDSVADLGSAPAGQAGGPPAAGGDSKGHRPFREFVTGALTDLTWKKADIFQVADRISNEFDERLNAATDMLRQEKETATRRLESVKNVVFAKLEAMSVMAILVDTGLNVLKMTSAARELIGNISTIPPASPLADCVKLKAAYMDIVVAGRPLTVQTIASDSTGSGETVLLLTLNPE